MADDQEGRLSRDALLEAMRRLPRIDSAEAENEIVDRVVERLARLNQRRRETDMTSRNGNGNGKVHFDWAINLGHVLTIVTLFGGFTVAYATYASKITSIENSIEASVARAQRYTPILELASKTNDVQDERIQNLAVAIQEIRRTNNETLSVLGNLREDMAQVRANLGIQRRGQP